MCDGNQFRLESEDNDFLEFFPIGQRGKRAYIYKGNYGLFEYYTGIIKQGTQYSIKTVKHKVDLSKIVDDMEAEESLIDKEIQEIKYPSSKNQTVVYTLVKRLVKLAMILLVLLAVYIGYLVMTDALLLQKTLSLFVVLQAVLVQSSPDNRCTPPAVLKETVPAFLAVSPACKPLHI